MQQGSNNQWKLISVEHHQDNPRRIQKENKTIQTERVTADATTQTVTVSVIPALPQGSSPISSPGIFPEVVVSHPPLTPGKRIKLRKAKKKLI